MGHNCLHVRFFLLDLDSDLDLRSVDLDLDLDLPSLKRTWTCSHKVDLDLDLDLRIVDLDLDLDFTVAGLVTCLGTRVRSIEWHHLLYGLSNSAIFSDPEQPITHKRRSVSHKRYKIEIVTME